MPAMVTFVTQSRAPETRAIPPTNSGRFATATIVNNSTTKTFQVRPPHTNASGRSAPRDPALSSPPPPVYNGILTAKDLPESLKEYGIYDQPSLDRAWASVVKQLRTQILTEQDVLDILQSGILQTMPGKELAALFVDALKRSEPLAGLAHDRLDDFVDIICNLAPQKWANSFGDDNFPLDAKCARVHTFIHGQLAASREQTDEKIAKGELLDDETWKALSELTLRLPNYLHKTSKSTLHLTLRKLKDLIDARPSTREAQTLMRGVVKAMGEYPSNERIRWPERFRVDVQTLKDRLDAIEIIDPRPDRSWLEEAVDLDSLRAKLSKIATPINSALTALGSMSLVEAGSALQSAANSLIEKAHDFAFVATTEPVSLREPALMPESALLDDLIRIERTSSFFENVIITGPRNPGGFWGPALLGLYVADTLGVLSIAQSVKPHLQAVPAAASPLDDTATQPGAQRVDAELDIKPRQLMNKAKALAVEVNDFIASQPPRVDTVASVAPPAALSEESIIGQWAQRLQDALSKIDAVLTFPAAAADQIETPLLDLGRELGVLEAADVEGQAVSTVQAVSSWWDVLAPQIYQVLSNLTPVIGALGNYALGTARVVNDHPREATVAAFVVASAIYNQLRARFPGSPPLVLTPGNQNTTGTTEPPIETIDPIARTTETTIDTTRSTTAATETTTNTTEPTPAVTETTIDVTEPFEAGDPIELLEDKIEDILQTPVGFGQPPLSAAILDEMYQSTEQDLLDDDGLLANVAALLKQHSTKDSERSYVELIQESQSHAHGKFKRDTKYAERTDPAINTARDAIQVLRKRHNAIWREDSRIAGDRKLVTHYADALTKIVDKPGKQTQLQVQVPINSQFGRCWLNFNNAIGNPFFSDWIETQGLDLKTVELDTATGSLSAKLRPVIATGTANDNTASISVGEGVRKTFSLDDDSGWANVAGPILQAASVIDPTQAGVRFPDSKRKAPFALVGAFHGEKPYSSKAEAEIRIQELNANLAFSEIGANDTQRPPELRSDAAIEQLKHRLGDQSDYHWVITELNELIRDKSDATLVKLDDRLMAVRKDATFAAKNPREARKAVSLQRFISANGWNVPKNVAETRNLAQVMSFAFPDSSKRGNYFGALTYPRELTPALQDILRNTVGQFAGSGPLFDHLLQSRSTGNPERDLELALDGDRASTLGQLLETRLGVISTSTSAAQWVMAALVLDLDPAPGKPRNHVAGYDLMQESNWGAKPSTVVANLQAHLVASGKATAMTAPAAAYHLLSGIAPEFLVRKMPDNLACGSHSWATFRIAVARIEQIAPGASAKMSFAQVMNYGETAAISEDQETAIQVASVDPLIDWAIANGVVAKSTDDSYTSGQLNIAAQKFDDARAELFQAGNYLSSPLPTRKELALAELTRVFGKDLPYEELCIKEEKFNEARSTPRSMLDLYMTGDLYSPKWYSFGKTPSSSFKFSELRPKFKDLEPIGALFEKAFTRHFDDLRSGSISIFKYLVSTLPLEDRKNLEYGTHKILTMRNPIDTRKPNQSTAAKDHIGHHGILIRCDFQGKISYYEVFPTSLEIRKRTDLPSTLFLGADEDTIRYVHPAWPRELAKPQPFDWSAYSQGSKPRNGVTSDIIIDEFTPQTQNNKAYPASYRYDNVVPNVLANNTRVEYLATTLVNEHFVAGRETLHALGWGSTKSEKEAEACEKIKEFFLNLVPFVSCVDDIKKGEVFDAIIDCGLDAAGFIFAGVGAAGKIAKVAKLGGKILPKIGKIIRIASSTLAANVNPLDGVGRLFYSGANAAYKFGKATGRAVNSAIENLKQLYGTSKAIDTAQLLKRADIAEGAFDAAQAVGKGKGEVTALFKNGKWYAFDVAGNRPYGPPLENFTPKSSIKLEVTTFSDGSSALTPSRLFDAEPHIIQRSSSIDVVVGNKVYRLDPVNPNVLDDISSPPFFKDMEGFESICKAGKNSKRDITKCFSKTVQNLADPLQKKAQAIEHKRLYPASDSNPRVVHERRIYDCDVGTFNCKPVPTNSPLEFKSSTTGSVIKDKHFGLPGRETDAALDKQTRVVRINSIVHGIEDKRDVRAFLIDIPDGCCGKITYLFAEADTGLFYYGKKSSSTIDFKKMDYKKVDPKKYDLSADLLSKYHELKNPHMNFKNAKNIPRNDFVALPSLETLYTDLAKLDKYSPELLSDLKRKVSKLSQEQQREFVLKVWNKEKIREIEISITAIKVEPIPKPPGFQTKTASEQNEIYALGAKKQVDKQVQATGLGPANQVFDNAKGWKRQGLTNPVVVWVYSQNGQPNLVDMFLKTGAGNCDQMARASARIIKNDGGSATIWAMPGHVFTVVGGPPKKPGMSTIDFAGMDYRDAWIVDSWADISCRAIDYNDAFRNKMISWHHENKRIFAEDSAGVWIWMDPTDEQWLAGLQKPKQPA